MKKSICFVVVLMLFFSIIFFGGCEDNTMVIQSDGSSDSSRDAQENGEQAKEVSNENSRSNPAGIGEAFTVYKDDWLTGKVTFEVTLIETITGEEAWQMVKAGNQFNDKPDEGKEYILAKFQVAVLETEEDEPFDINHAMFSAISGGGIEYGGFLSVAGIEPNLRVDLYEGAVHEGFTYFMVDTDDENPLAVMDRRRSSEIWFKLR